jgi:hypothetical protein
VKLGGKFPGITERYYLFELTGAPKRSNPTVNSRNEIAWRMRQRHESTLDILF